MHDIYNFILSEEDFKKLKEGKKKVHLVVANKDNETIAIGNEITFESEQPTDENDNFAEHKKVEAIVKEVLYFPSFMSAIETLGREKCGFKEKMPLEKTSDEFLADKSVEKINKNGIVALIFKLEKK